MTTPPGGSRLAEDLPEDLFGPTLAPQWSHDGKGAALLEGGRAPQAKSRQAEDRPWRGQDDKGGDSWTGGGGGLQGLRAPIDAAVRPRWREDERQIGPRRPDARWGVAEHDGMRRAENGPQRPLADIPALAGSPVERWGGDAGRGRGRGPPGPTPPRWGAPGPERHQHPDRWGGPIAPETRPREARDKWEKWGGFEGGPKEPHMPHDDKWRPPHVGFGHSPGAGPRDAPSFGPPGGHAFMEPRGDPVPAGRGRGFAIGRGRSIPGPAHAPGADHRWGAHHPHPPAVGDDSYAIGRQPSKHDPSQSLGSKAKYPSSKMLAVFSQLEAKHALALPAGVNRDEPSLFAVSGQPTVMEVLHGNHNKLPEGDRLSAPDTPAQQAQAPSADSKLPPAQKPANSASAETHSRPQSAHQQSSAASPTPSTSIAQGAADSQQPTASPFATAAGSSASAAPEPSISSEHVQDAWVYRDPNWQVQGPFSKADILDWFEGGFFPATLPIRHASNPQADFKPLAAQIKVWAAAAPPGFARQEPQSSMPASTQPATPAQQPPVEQQPSRSAASAHQQQQQQQPQSQADINRTYTLTTAGSNSASYMGPNSASSARLDELETGVNKSSVPEPAHPAAEPVGMDLIHMLTRGHSGASTSQSALPTPGQDPLTQFTGLQQGLSAAAPWGHQAQTGSAASGPFDHSNPILGPVGSSLAPHDPFASRPFNQPMRQDPPQQHALPAFLTSATNHVADRSHSGLQDRGMFSQPFASHPQASLDHLNLGAAGLGMQPQQQHQQASLWGGQQHAQSTAQLFGGLKRPEQQQSQQPQQGALSDFQRLLQQALPQQQHQPPPSPLQVSHPTSKAPESPGAPPHPPAAVQQESEPVAAPPKRKAAAPKKAAPGPNPQPAAAPTPAWAMPEQAPPSLAGVQLEQQQQQQQLQQQQRQQEQQQLPDWGLPSEAPASPKKAETKAPWGAAKPPVPAGGNLHDILREEEAKAAAARAAQPASTDVKTAAPGANRASGWARVAASPTASRGHVQTLKEIQEEEERARRSEARQQQTQQQQPDQAQGGFSLRDSFVGEAQALVAPKMAPWAAAAGRHQEESASDLEGGDSGYHQEHFTQPPPPPPRKPAPAKEDKKKTAQEVKREQMEEQRRAAAAARQEIKEDKKPKQAAAGPAPSMALRTAASLQRALSNDDDGMFWDYGPAAGQRGNGSIPAPAAAKPAGQANGRPPASQQWQSPQTSPGPPPTKPLPQDMPATPETIKMSSEFKTWASQKIRSLSKGRIDDPSILLDVLMDTPSNGEVVEGCLVNIERNGDVSAFATEFIRRKAAELAGHKGKAKATPAAVPPGSSSAAAPIPAAAASDPSKFQKVPKANKGKKGKASKGQKVGNQLLGFSTKSDFSVLERGDDYA